MTLEEYQQKVAGLSLGGLVDELIQLRLKDMSDSSDKERWLWSAQINMVRAQIDTREVAEPTPHERSAAKTVRGPIKKLGSLV